MILAIIVENTHRFQLAHTLPTFQKDILLLIALCGQTHLYQTIMSNKAELQSNNEELNHFIILLCKDNPIDINTK